jgi:TonB family protein
MLVALGLVVPGLAAAQTGTLGEPSADSAPAHAGAGQAPPADAAAADAAAAVEARAERDGAPPSNASPARGEETAAAADVAAGATGAYTAAPADQAAARTDGAAGTDGDAGTDGAAETGSAAARADEPGEPAQPGAGAGVATRLEALIELGRLMDEKSYEKAVPVGEQLVRLTEQEFGNSLETAEAYVSLARAESEAGRHEQSEQDYLHGIELIRSIDGNFSERAIDPLVGLGDNYQGAKQYLNAVTSYSEARTISRRVYGLLSERQVPILDKMSDSFIELDQITDADARQLDILRLAERNYEVGSPEYLEGIYRYAAYLRKTGRYNEEREQYDRVIRLIRDQHGKESPLLVRALRETANSFRMQRIPDPRGVGALESALELLEMQPKPDPLHRAEVLRDLGDWDVAFADGEPPDTKAYVQAWQLLGSVDNGESLRKDWFGDLENVLGEPINQRGLSNDPKAPQGYVVVQFDVDEQGQTRNVQVVKSEPQGFKDDAVARAVRRWRYRPFMLDGAIVPKDRVAVRFNFGYEPGEEDRGV